MAKDFPPQEFEDGSVLISPAQVKVHKTTEALSVLFGVPVMLWAATRPKPLTKTERAGLMVLAFGALAVDSYLYNRFARATKKRKKLKRKKRR